MINQYQNEKKEVKGIFGIIELNDKWKMVFHDTTVHDYNQYKELRQLGFDPKPMSDVWKGTYLHESLEEYFKKIDEPRETGIQLPYNVYQQVIKLLEQEKK